MNTLLLALQAVCPVVGCSSSGRIDFDPSATDAQKAAAQAIMTTYLAHPASWLAAQPLTFAQVKALGSAYLAGLGWDTDTILAAISNSPGWNSTLQSYFAANVAAISTMWAAGKAAVSAGANTFNPASYSIPHPPSDFNL